MKINKNITDIRDKFPEDMNIKLINSFIKQFCVDEKMKYRMNDSNTIKQEYTFVQKRWKKFIDWYNLKMLMAQNLITNI